MTIHRISTADPDSWPAAWDTHQPGGRIILDGGVYPYSLDSYRYRIVGGETWGTRTRIEARVRTVKGKRVADKVVLKPVGGDFALRLAFESNSYLQIGTAKAPIEIDASGLEPSSAATGVKVTNSGTGCAHHVQLSVHVHHAHRQGILTTGTHHVTFLGGSSRDNGWDLEPHQANKNHNLYLGGGTWDCLVQDFDTSGSAAYGISEYGGETPGGCGRNRIVRGFHLNNGRLALRAGVLLSGDDSHAERVTSSGNMFGVECYRTARRCSFSGFLEGNRDGRAYIAAGAVDCVEVPL